MHDVDIKMRKVAQAFIGRMVRPWLWADWIYYKTKRGQAFKVDAAKMDEFTRKVIVDRKSELLDKLKNKNGIVNKDS
ncbi:cytochrome P450 4c3 [Trichonephila inaurata madagascariensis]|uniref:Cytochrome P450 4c3 n=1 Tax=Trichonephila inaurata madagascariensis TaxID=2747483 RepID=A0A8X6XX57_9ARAC|nr:cytochrome P450 4c3 [Trichonephila inaurata madagascariensis]